MVHTPLLYHFLSTFSVFLSSLSSLLLLLLYLFFFTHLSFSFCLIIFPLIYFTIVTSMSKSLFRFYLFFSVIAVFFFSPLIVNFSVLHLSFILSLLYFISFYSPRIISFFVSIFPIIITYYLFITLFRIYLLYNRVSILFFFIFL